MRKGNISGVGWDRPPAHPFSSSHSLCFLFSRNIFYSQGQAIVSYNKDCRVGRQARIWMLDMIDI